MTSAALMARPLPSYTKTEEFLNSFSHALGVVFGIFVLISCIGVSSGTPALIGSIVYGTSIILLYAMSSIYHGLNPSNLLAKQILRVADHCTIFVLIAGTYTPVILTAIYPYAPVKSLIILGCIWAAAIVGIIFTAIDLQKYSRFSMVCYIALGWFALFLIPSLIASAGISGLALLIGGGVSYTIGAVLYGIGKRKRYMHFVFHLFVIIGTVLHFICIYSLIKA